VHSPSSRRDNGEDAPANLAPQPRPTYLAAMVLRLRPLPLGFVAPCLPTAAVRPPSGPLWVHEIKHDGYRLMAWREGDDVRLLYPPAAMTGANAIRPWWPRCGPCKPILRRIFGDLEVNNFPSVMAEDEQGVEKPKRRGYHNEHVDGGQVVHVVVQK